MDFFFDDASPYKEDFRNLHDINYIIKEKPDIGLPTVIDRKQISQYQEILEKRRMKFMAEAIPKYKYLLETISWCIRSCKFSSLRSPYQLDELNYEGLTQPERDLFIPEAKFLKKVFYQTKRNRSINAIC